MPRWLQQIRRTYHLNVQLKPCDEPTDFTWKYDKDSFTTILKNDADRVRFLQPFGIQPSEYLQGTDLDLPQASNEALRGQRLIAYPYYAPTRAPLPAMWVFQKE